MQGINIAEQGHVVNVLPPINIAGGKTGDRFKMNNYGHATIIVQLGVSASAPTSITLKAADAASAGNTADIGFDYYAETTAAGDTLSGKTTVDTNGLTTVTANDNTMYVIEIDAAGLPEGKPWVEIALNNASGNSVIASAVAILSGSRYANDQSDTAIA